MFYFSRMYVDSSYTRSNLKQCAFRYGVRVTRIGFYLLHMEYTQLGRVDYPNGKIILKLLTAEFTFSLFG